MVKISPLNYDLDEAPREHIHGGKTEAGEAEDGSFDRQQIGIKFKRKLLMNPIISYSVGTLLFEQCILQARPLSG